MSSIGAFLHRLLEQHDTWRRLPLTVRAGDGWCGTALAVPPPPGSDLAGPLDIEETGGEVTISLDYSHIHMEWPPPADSKGGNLWADPLAMVEAIVSEKVLSLSGWIDGRLRAGSLQEVDQAAKLLVSGIQRIRVRSWRGTFDRDEEFTSSS